MSARLSGLTGATIETAPAVCHECVWWQSRNGRAGRAGSHRATVSHLTARDA